MIPDFLFLPLARCYLQATAGALVPGFVHNMNNFLQVLDMQLELLGRKSAGGFPPPQAFQPSLDRLGRSVTGLAEQLHQADKRAFYCAEEQTQIVLAQYLTWLKAVWSNNLFVKHHVQIDVKVEDGVPDLELLPFCLTLCLEEPLKNAVEACQAVDVDSPWHIRLLAQAMGSGVSLRILSPVDLPQGLDPWIAGSTCKPGHLGFGLTLVKHFANALGWATSLARSGTDTEFRLSIPLVRTQAPLTL